MKALRVTGKASHAFTLIEVILAIAIVAGLLAVALYFYQQAAHLRTELLLETERISASRLLMDKLTAELRCARRHSYFQVPLLGRADSIQFITTSLPTRSVWSGEAYGRVTRPESDLKYVTYKVAGGEVETNIVGLARDEEPLVEFRKVPEAGSAYATVSTNRVRGIVVTEQLRSIRFRYWDGTAWQPSWNETRLPAAVEITLAPDPAPVSAEEEVMPVDSDTVYRRVVYLPGSEAPAPLGRSSSTNNTFETTEEMTL